MYPAKVKAMIEHANSQRYSITEEKNKEHAIEISEGWKKELEKMPFVSQQKGRMSHLLKQKSKVAAIQRERTTYEAFDFKKKLKLDDGTERTFVGGKEQKEE